VGRVSAGIGGGGGIDGFPSVAVAPLLLDGGGGGDDLSDDEHPTSTSIKTAKSVASFIRALLLTVRKIRNALQRITSRCGNIRTAIVSIERACIIATTFERNLLKKSSPRNDPGHFSMIDQLRESDGRGVDARI
jgi:hypothetical protein